MQFVPLNSGHHAFTVPWWHLRAVRDLVPGVPHQQSWNALQREPCWERSFRCLLQEQEFAGLCFAVWKTWGDPAACQWPVVQQLQQLLHPRNHPELPGLQPQPGFMSRAPHAWMDVLCFPCHPQGSVYTSKVGHTQLRSSPVLVPTCQWLCPAQCSARRLLGLLLPLLAAAPAAWTSAPKTRVFLFLFPLTLMNGLDLNAKAHLFLTEGDGWSRSSSGAGSVS